MAQVVQYSCDVCKKVKGDTNHWWRVYVEKGESLDGKDYFPVLIVTPFDVYTAAPPDEFIVVPEKHACGSQCLNQLVYNYVCLETNPASNKPAV